MSDRTSPSAREGYWQSEWEKAGVYSIDFSKATKPYYSLVMFPYPSGDRLHIGHWYQYGPCDSFARFMRMQGNDVFAPMGFDAFGLPAENHAIKHGEHPDGFTDKNVQTMIEQLKKIGCMYDWDKSVNTSKPDYYRWTQWLFLQMHKNGLAYKKLGNVNYCTSCQTVLANEQAQDGVCERCGTTVIQKPLEQWYWKITKYAEKLLGNLDQLDWPEKTKLMQTNWIGKSEGAEIVFEIEGQKESVTVFTTRPDTLFGATYLVLAPEHALVQKITAPDHAKAVEKYIAAAAKKTELERKELQKTKTGEFTGAYALHPVTGEQVPIWIADYVLTNYGTGAIMAVPAHDERDHDFAKAFNLPMKEVVKGEKSDGAFTGEGESINSDFLDGLNTPAAKKKMIEWLVKNKKGKGVTNFRLRDWLVSRQRYWGAPIPIVYDPEGNPHPVPDEHLPWTLPTDVEFKPTGESPLRYSKEFQARTEKIFGKGWRPEYDTMDTFVCSSFYYLRYLNSGQWLVGSGQSESGMGKLTTNHSSLTTSLKSEKLIDPSIERTWMPVSMYVGGPEHACMHLIYARFVMMALKDFGFVSHEEPFQKLVHQGLITNQGAKMSKSKGNVVSPDSFVEKFGSDVFRMYLMFMGPFTEGGDWSDAGIMGIVRFVDRLERCLTEKSKGTDSPETLKRLHKTIRKVSTDMNEMKFNTVISALMELLNHLEKEAGFSSETAKTVATLLSPIAPHLAEELWHALGEKSFIVLQSWPMFDEALTKDDTVTIVVQVNGKLRGEMQVPAGISKDEVIAQAKALENVQKFLTGEIKKEVYVPGKLVSLVVK
ncbi:MAG: leucine--tRNA ligase [Candidatus Peribacteraceae bacterium]